MHETQLSTKNDSFLKEFNFRRHWKHASAILSCFVVLGTLSALTLPAVTMNQPAVCGKEEHIHTDSCYMVPEEKVLSCNAAPHIHDSGCYGEAGNLLCGQADFFLHTHDDLCYDTDGNLVCQLPEISEHAHSDDCYIQTEITVEEGHQHTDDCFSQVPSSEPACGLEDTDGHTHSEGCSITESILTCELAEDETHTHDDSCYEAVATLTCTEAEAQAHHHEETCFPPENGQLLCEMEECDPVVAPGEPELICTETEIIQHIHVETCLDNGTYLCGQAEIPRHSHTESCFCDAAPVLICEAEAHTHEDMCYSDPNADLETPEIWESSLPPADTFMGIWSQDLIFVAESQIGYTESVHNFVLDEHGSHKGYSRYGAWYGEPYADWNPLFLSFCLHYAGIPEEAISRQSDLTLWQEEFTEAEAWYSLADCIPVPGDLIFLDLNGDGVPDQAGLFTKRIEGTTPEASLLCIILGDKENAVIKQEYKTSDPTLLSCVSLDKLHSNWEASQNPTDPTEPGETVPEETLPVETPPGTLSAQGDGYSFTLTCPAEAALPEGTTLQAQALASESETYQTLYSQLPDLLGDAAISSVWMYDITLQAEQAAVEPAAPVTVELILREAVSVQEGHRYLAVHFGSSGPEILSVEAIVAEDLLTGFRHTQDSFSPTVYVSVDATENPSEIGPDWLPIDYYVYIDGEWTLVGSTKTGWYGTKTASDAWSDENRDYITVEQAKSILEPYGFTGYSNGQAILTLFYQRNNEPDYNLHNDTNCYLDVNSNAVIPLAKNVIDTMGYNLYYSPATTAINHPSLSSLTVPASSKFHTVSVWDANHLVYEPGEELPNAQVIQNGHSVTVTVKNSSTGWQWNAADGTITTAAGTAVDDSHTDYTLQSVTQAMHLSPANHNLDGATASKKPVHIVVWLDGAWTEVGTLDTSYYKEGLCEGSNDSSGNPRYRWFITTEQAYSVLAPFGFDPADIAVEGDSISPSKNGEIKCMYFMHQTGAINTSGKDVYSSGNWNRLPDGKTWAIGMSYNNQEYTMYYVPGSNQYYQGDGKLSHTADLFAATSSNLDGSRFYSVTVEDENHLVYDAAALESMTTYVKEGGNATVQVENAHGVLWTNNTDLEPFQDENTTTFPFENIQQPIVVSATEADPVFTVQYYGEIVQYVTSGSKNHALPVIDTQGKNLPQNGGTHKLLNIFLRESRYTAPDYSANNYLYEVETTQVVTKLYTEESFHYTEHPGLEYVDKLAGNDYQKPKQIGVLKDGKSPNTNNMSDFDWYYFNHDLDNIHFTNVAGAATSLTGEKTAFQNNFILITSGTVLRILYESFPEADSYVNSATFHDYDITSNTTTSSGRLSVGVRQINNRDYYLKSRTEAGDKATNGLEGVYAFGNANCMTGLGNAMWGKNELNKFNNNNSDVEGTTFGLVTGFDENNNIIWNKNINAPKDLFSLTPRLGKTSYTGGTLTFNRIGDTYTLTAADSTAGSRTDLEYFFTPKLDTSTRTNNFWVLDDATNKKDPLMGGSELAANGYKRVNKANKLTTMEDGTLPPSDDGEDHNWFFGMNFAISFSLTEDYVGPLDYLFFGDDDLWIFLTNNVTGEKQLICDIGGVHISVGEYVDLWDYIEKGKSGSYTLNFFYTERGASGSTCWMSFTLPSVTSSTTGQDVGMLQISKAVVNPNGGNANAEFIDEEFEFEVALKTSANGASLPGTYSYIRTDINRMDTYGSVKDGGTLKLSPGDIVWITGLPAGTWYSVTETAESRKFFNVSVNDESGYITKGEISSGSFNVATFVNQQKVELPSTGGAGTLSYTFSGLSLTGLACLMYSHTRKRRKGGT